MDIIFKDFSNKDNKLLVDFLTSEIWPFNVTSKLTSTKAIEWIKADRFIKPENKAYWIILDNEKRIGLICLDDVGDTLMMYPEFEIWISSAFRTGEILEKIIQSFINDFLNKYKEAVGILTQMRQDDSIIRHVYHQCGFTKEGHR